jgi:hypothetical protein
MVMAPSLVVQWYCTGIATGGAGNPVAALIVSFTRSCACSATVNASKSGGKLAANAVRKLVGK